VDPDLKGKVKITVIATGFGPQGAVRTAPAASMSGASTPIDMTQYADHARIRADVGTLPAAAMPRLSIARRPLLDLPMLASGGGAPALGGVPARPEAAAGSSTAGAGEGAAEGVADPGGPKIQVDPDFDLSSTFDVPAFLRRQEG